MGDDDKWPNILSRRAMLALMGGAAVAVAAGCGDDSGSSGTATGTRRASTTPAASPSTATAATPAQQAATATATAAPSVSCVVTPELTEGPYFVDEMLLRSDIRSDPTIGAVKEGVPLTIDMVVSRVSAGACSPLEGAIVDTRHRYAPFLQEFGK